MTTPTVNLGRFGTAVACIDGRIQQPVADWLRARFLLDHVDMITWPGADRALCGDGDPAEAAVARAIRISLDGHGSTVVALVAHDGCLANPVDEAEHHAHVRRAMQTLRRWNVPATVLGLWVDARGEVRTVGEA